MPARRRASACSTSDRTAASVMAACPSMAMMSCPASQRRRIERANTFSFRFGLAASIASPNSASASGWSATDCRIARRMPTFEPKTA